MPSVRRSGARAPLLALLVLFFLSGASALVYQVLWMRLLALVFGVTVHAASTVLAAFMMGLAFGSAAAGRLADRLARPLHAFAAAEALIAVAALATPVLFAAVLRSRGIALQWIGSGAKTEYKLIMRTFLRVFPHTTLWEGGTLMVGAQRPLRLDPEAFERKLQRLESRSALRSMGFGSFDDLLAKYVAGPEELRAFVGEGPILTDERPLTEYFLSLPQDDRPVDLSAVRGNVQRHVLASPSTRP